MDKKSSKGRHLLQLSAIYHIDGMYIELERYSIIMPRNTSVGRLDVY